MLTTDHAPDAGGSTESGPTRPTSNTWRYKNASSFTRNQTLTMTMKPRIPSRIRHNQMDRAIELASHPLMRTRPTHENGKWNSVGQPHLYSKRHAQRLPAKTPPRSQIMKPSGRHPTPCPLTLTLLYPPLLLQTTLHNQDQQKRESAMVVTGNEDPNNNDDSYEHPTETLYHTD